MRTIYQKLFAILTAGLLAASLAGCGARVTGVTLTLPETLERGTSLAATPEYAFDGATPESAAYEKKIDALGMVYTSSDPEVISVDDNGNINALRPGTAEVAMKSADGKITAAQTVEVVVTPTDLTMTDSLTLTESDSPAQLDVKVQPSDATHVKLDFASSDEAVATVTAGGMVEAKAAGSATITAAVEGTDLTAECAVTVLPTVQEIVLSDAALSLKKGDAAQLTYTVQPENAVDPGASFSSSNESIAAVDSEGNVTAMADGISVITVTVAGVTAECKVTVYTPAPKAQQSQQASGNTAGSAQDSTPAASSGFEYGAVPFSLANDGCWWYIDRADSAYWAVLNNINAMRAAGGLAPLSANSSLDAIADSRCDYQLVNDTLSHDGAQTPEILAQSQKSASEVCTGWQNSPAHYAVIMNPNFTQIGICCYFEIGGKTIWCCTFG